MQYVAAVSGKGREVDRVKEQLLQSNPVLEGNSNNIVKLTEQHNDGTVCGVVRSWPSS